MTLGLGVVRLTGMSTIPYNVHSEKVATESTGTEVSPSDPHCAWCGEPIGQSLLYGWRHLGGGAAFFACRCGWMDAPVDPIPACPLCRSPFLDIDHLAEPEEQR